MSATVRVGKVTNLRFFNVGCVPMKADGTRANTMRSQVRSSVVSPKPAVVDQDRLYRFIQAVQEDSSTAETLLAETPELLTARTGIEETALHYLVIEDQLESVRWLLAHRAPTNTRNYTGSTPLMDAARLSYLHMVQLLLEYGADVHARAPGEETVLHLAAGADARIITMLIRVGTDLEVRDELGNTPLHAATAAENLPAVEALLDAGADITARNTCQRSALFAPAQEGNLSIVRLLIERGIDPTMPDADGRTALDEARARRRTHVAEFLNAAIDPRAA